MRKGPRQIYPGRGFWRGRAAAGIIALLAASLLMGLGYQLGRQSQRRQVELARLEAMRQADRAGRLLALNRSLEKRLAACRTARTRRKPRPVPAKPGMTGQELRTLHRGRAVVALGGELVLTLEEISAGRPRRARIRVQVRGGRQGVVVLRAGSSVGIRLPGDRGCRLLVKSLHASSASVALLPR